MAFGPIMRLRAGELSIELAPLTRDVMGEFINLSHGGGMQRRTVIRYMGRQLAPTLQDEYDWFDKTRADQTNVIWGIWVVGKDERILIGTSGLNGIGKDGHAGFIRQATSGSMIFRPEYWGKGIASAAHKARTWYAFQYLGLHRIKSAVLQGNLGSSKALSRSGYTFVYTERNESYGDSQLHHLDCFECLNPIDLFWRQWWHGDTPPAAARQARRLTREAMAWAEENVELA